MWHCFYKIGNSSQSANAIYQKTNENVEKFTKIAFMLMTQMLVPFFTISHIAMSIFNYVHSNYSRDAFEQIYPATWVTHHINKFWILHTLWNPNDTTGSNGFSSYILRYPFDWQTPTGFLVCAATQAATVFARGQLIICTLSLVAGFSMFVSDFVSDMEEVLRDLNNDLTARKMELFRQRNDIKKKFVGFIQLDAQAKELGISIKTKCWSVVNTIYFQIYQLFFGYE